MAGTTTGDAILADVGTLSYNGVTWSSLYKTKLNGQVVKDAANRTTKWVEWTLEVEGVVTLEPNQTTTDATYAGLRQRLSVHGGNLKYVNKGFGNTSLNSVTQKDVAWGPVPEVLTFQPMGQARSALITWRIVFRVAELPAGSQGSSGPFGQVLQFNYEYALEYDDKGYASATFTGTLEIPQTRQLNSRVVKQTVDAFRQNWLNIAFDLTKYKIIDRDFKESRDQRTCEWVYKIKQHTPAGLPVGAFKASGRMTVRNLRPGGGKSGTPLVSPRWACTLSCTYTVRADYPRRIALFSFMALLWFRMWSAVNGDIPGANNAQAVQQRKAAATALHASLTAAAAPPDPTDLPSTMQFYKLLTANNVAAGGAALLAVVFNGADLLSSLPLLMDFQFDEGLYDDSETMSFQASWSMTTSFTSLLAATGVWKYNQDVGGTAWGTSMQNVLGWSSTLKSQLDPNALVIVDMGGGSPLSRSPLLNE